MVEEELLATCVGRFYKLIGISWIRPVELVGLTEPTTQSYILIIFINNYSNIVKLSHATPTNLTTHDNC